MVNPWAMAVNPVIHVEPVRNGQIGRGTGGGGKVQILDQSTLLWLGGAWRRGGER